MSTSEVPSEKDEPGGSKLPHVQSSEGASSVARQLENADPGNAGTTTPADESPVSDDQLTSEVPDSPKGVGKSTTRSAEDVAKKEGTDSDDEEGEEGESGRPAGSFKASDRTGVDPQEPRDSE